MKKAMPYLLLAIVCLLAGRFSAVFPLKGPVTTSRLSPSENLRAVLAESPFRFIDRNFRIYLEDLKDEEASQTIFSSPDEGLPIGSERFLWSNDDSRLLLVGKHFCHVHPGALLTTGEYVYFLYDVATRKAWCNSTQQKDLPRFGKAELEESDYGERLVLQKEPQNNHEPPVQAALDQP
ncbi:MAG TPA: hypothetical protein VMY42_02070 [Thermoguttaceae bacterium]|nr:hypothetical protein [Thermoguttaceae bacterium]